MNSEDRNKKIAELEAEISKLKQEFFCSFCGKSSRDLICLIAGPNCFICDECTDICAAIVNERRLRISANDEGAITENAVAAEATKPPSAPK